MKEKLHILAILLLLSFGGCSSDPLNKARVEFQKQCPECEVISVAPVEGDFSTVYIEIRYLENKKEKKVEWQYMKKDGEWKLTSKYADP